MPVAGGGEHELGGRDGRPQEVAGGQAATQK